MRVLDLKWRVLPEHLAINHRLETFLLLWRGTPYLDGNQCPGYGVDCFRFVCGVLDSLEGKKRHLDFIPRDQSMHDREGASRAMRTVLEMYRPFETVDNGQVEPGDIFITGANGGGPGHALIAGLSQGELWHVPGPNKKVRMTGTGINGQLFRIYRVSNKLERWGI